MIQIDMQMPKNCADCCFATADLVNGIITLFCMTQAGRRMYAPDLISRKDRPEWCPLKEQEADKPKGHWTPYEPDKRGYTDGFECSRCERVILSDHYCKMIDFDFCPYCGAYMDDAEGL